ncbi:hypothetical protein [Pseudobutyrivibrio ruminis]|uniref:hypothetical protein n=1 Tax=Pseudobutyrivibrio ruminis TaxID=46206 RepID=UPI00051AC33F|nr:hypothetical protein [Pseudobutyrivibrio ruminis]
MEKRQSTKIILLKILAFVIGLCLMMNRLTTLLMLKEYPVGANVNILLNPYILGEKPTGFYSLEDDTLDVVFLGSSNVHCNINPNIIWNQYGITSYDFTGDQQDLGTTYYYLQQVFKTQSPKLVMIDILNGGAQESLANDQAHFSYDYMKNDMSKVLGIWNRTKGSRLEMYFPIITYHDRWKELTQRDYTYSKDFHNSLNGAFIYMVQNEQPGVQLPEDMPVENLSNKTIKWVQSIQALCEKNNCQCVFIKTPFSQYKEDYFPYFAAFGEYCQENNIQFIDMNNYADAIGIDYATDFVDEMHMNWIGQQKLSNYIGDIISGNYEFEDKRNNSEFSQWNDDYDTMMYYINNFDVLYSESGV